MRVGTAQRPAGPLHCCARGRAHFAWFWGATASVADGSGLAEAITQCSFPFAIFYSLFSMKEAGRGHISDYD